MSLNYLAVIDVCIVSLLWDFLINILALESFRYI